MEKTRPISTDTLLVIPFVDGYIKVLESLDDETSI